MTLEVTKKRVFTALIFLLSCLCGLAVLFQTVQHRSASAPPDLHAEVLRQPGDAPPAVKAGVQAALRPFGESRMLPSPAYTDPAVFAWEQKHFFGGGWSCVGFASELSSPGDQRAVQVGDGSVLLTRDGDGQLHADRKSTRLNSSHPSISRMPSSA